MHAKQPSRCMLANDKRVLDRLLLFLLKSALIPRPARFAGLLFEMATFEEQASMLRALCDVLYGYVVHSPPPSPPGEGAPGATVEHGRRTQPLDQLDARVIKLLRMIAKRHIMQVRDVIAVFYDA
jgi:hypothetical protein